MNDLAQKIDHTCLKPEADQELILKYCREAREHNFASVCINPYWVSTVHQALKDTQVKTCTVIGFPLGATFPRVKADEVLLAKKSGAQEFDMVMNISALKSGEEEHVFEDIKSVVEAAQGDIVKVILETCLLSPHEITRASKIALEAGAQYIKTSTGFSKSGASLEAVKLMKEVAQDKIKIKASGGIKTKESALEFIKAGADRIGASSSLNLIDPKSP